VLPRSAADRVGERLTTLRLFLHEQEDPEPFHTRLADSVASSLPDLRDARVIDLGCGPGHYTRALRRRGAWVQPIDLDMVEFALPGGPPGGELVANGMALPVRTASVDGLVCSNMIEHTPDPVQVLSEIERVVRPEGWIWLSWTNWFSPWGGHDISPFHYLGPRRGLRAYRRVTGKEPKNVPMESLFPLHIGPMLREIRRHPRLRVVRAEPRYYPSQRWILQIPGVREIFTWNIALFMERCA
jgi:SAM-dependent methyltransferase